MTGAEKRAEKPLLLRDPSVSTTHIAFSYAGTLWIANRDGNDSRCLTIGGHESKPVLSPDGAQLAFIGTHDGCRSVCAMPACGGESRRLTFHPADLGTVMIGMTGDMLGWTPDGKSVLFSSRRAAFAAGVVQLFTVPSEGGFVTPVPLVRASQASFSADATRIAYVANVKWQPAWKRYKGGQATRIRIAALADSRIEVEIPGGDFSDFNPMWVGDLIYFLSDRGGSVTLYSYDITSGHVAQVFEAGDLDLKCASACSDAIVYERFGSIHLLDLETGKDRVVDVRPTADFPEARPHLRNVATMVEGWSPFRKIDARISPTGAAAVFGVRGEVLAVSAEKGDVRNLTNTTGVVERDPAWSPDGKSMAYFCDESGEYALHVRDLARDEVSKFELGPSNFGLAPAWSPDSTKIAYADNHLSYWYVDLRGGTPVRVDTDFYAHRTIDLHWSPDSRWIAYTKRLRSHMRAVFIYSIEEARSRQLTDGMSDALHVAFDKAGRYLYFTASTDIGFKASWLDMTSLGRSLTRSVYAVALGKETESTASATTGRVEIDFEGIEGRIVALPIPARNYDTLFAGKPEVLYLLEKPQVEEPLDSLVGGPPKNVHRFDLRTREMKHVLSEVLAFDLSFDGEKMLYATRSQEKQDRSPRRKWFIGSADICASDPADRGQPLRLDGMAVYVEPRLEWRHMFDQAWRNLRDFFYDPGLHGVDIEGIKSRYEPLLDNISSRDDLDYLFEEMFSNLSVGHMHVGGPDSALIEPRPATTGLLGADYAVVNDRYRFARIYARDTWNPGSRCPLSEPGVKIEVGEYLLEVDGREVRTSIDVYSYFQNKAGNPVKLKVGRSIDGDEARTVTVVPVDDESALRNLGWVEDSRRAVDELTGGRVAYVYLPDTSAAGYAAFNRQFFAQVGKEAVIVDIRYNGGGAMPDYIIDCLRRPLLSAFHLREGSDITTPQQAIFGPKVMIINEMAGSGGEALAWMFRAAALGPLVGKRTWGGLVGSYTNPLDLLDGGFIATPGLAFCKTSGDWDIENCGVAPDVEIDECPQEARMGRDKQLRGAVDAVLKLLPR